MNRLFIILLLMLFFLTFLPSAGWAAADIHHIRLEHNTQGLTCEAERVTVKACADENCTTLYEEDVEVTLGFDGSTPAGASWESSPITLSNGKGEAKLRMTQHGEVTLKVVSSDPAATDSFVCVGSNETTDCKITFVDVGLRIGHIDGASGFNEGIPAQIAGKPSNEGWNAFNFYVQAIKKDDTTGACVAAVEGNQEVHFRYSVVDDQGLTDNTIRIYLIGSTNPITLNRPSDKGSLALTFDGEDGKAPFYFVSEETGRYRLTVELKNTGDGSSNAFVVRPLAVFVDAGEGSYAQNAEAEVFVRAGEDFNLTFTPVRWTAKADDDNEDGIWDRCGEHDLSFGDTPARAPAWLFTGPQPSLRLPADGNRGSLSYPGHHSDGDAGQTMIAASYSEVGIIQFSTGADSAPINTVDFLGEEVAVCSPYIGRFIPHHLHIKPTEPDSVTGACGSFTYFEQDGFITTFTLQARNKQEDITENYIGDFAKFDLSQWGRYRFAVAEADLPEGSAFYQSLDPDFPKGSWDKGSATVQAKHLITRSDTPIEPQHPTILARPIDTDEVTTFSEEYLPVHDNGLELRYGRLHVGTTDARLPTNPAHVRVEAQYFDGNNWLQNAADNCTDLNLDDFCLSNNQQKNQNPTIRVGSGTSTLTLGEWNDGEQTLTLSAPGENNSGFVDITALLNDKPWLQYDWGSGSFTDNPTGRASWGLYRGHPNVIYLREIWR